MAVYAIITYDITDSEKFGQYMGVIGVVMATIAKHGGEVLFADTEAVYLQGESRTMNLGIKFPNAEAVGAFENDPDYAEAKELRNASTANYTVFIAKQFTPPQ